jgi:hypothetical protein
MTSLLSRNPETGLYREGDIHFLSHRIGLVIPRVLDIHLEDEPLPYFYVISNRVSDIGGKTDRSGNAVQSFFGACRAADGSGFRTDADDTLV